MKYYLLEPFAKDLSVEKNPPLSEKGIRMARVFALTMKGISIDYCYTDTSIASFGTALLLVGDKLIVNKVNALDRELEENVTSFIEEINNKYKEGKILIIAEKVYYLLLISTLMLYLYHKKKDFVNKSFYLL